MPITLTEKEQTILNFAASGCCCESYYRYQCSMCKAIGQGLLQTHAEEIERLRILGFIIVGGYSYLNITKQGRELL